MNGKGLAASPERVRKILTGRGVGYQFSASREDPNTLSIPDLDPDTTGLAVRRVHDHHVGEGDEAFILDDTALLGACATGLQVTLLDPDLLNANSPRLRIHSQNATLFPTVGSLNHLNKITFSNALHVFLRSNKRCECIEQGGRLVKAPVGLIALFLPGSSKEGLSGAQKAANGSPLA